MLANFKNGNMVSQTSRNSIYFFSNFASKIISAYVLYASYKKINDDIIDLSNVRCSLNYSLLRITKKITKQ